MTNQELHDLICEYEKALFKIATSLLLPYESKDLAISALQHKNKYLSTQLSQKG